MRAFTEPTEGGATLSRREDCTNSTLDISDFSDGYLAISDAPAVMLISMSNEQRKVIFTEQDILDAQRLLRVLVERSERNKASGSLKAPEQIAEERCGQDFNNVLRRRPS